MNLKYRVNLGQRSFEVTLLERKDTSLSFEVNGETYQVNVDRIIAGSESSFQERRLIKSSTNEIRSPMAGIVTSVVIKPGDQVNEGQMLLSIEAMKMENPITAARSGTVEEVLVKCGGEVKAGEVLVLLAG